MLMSDDARARLEYFYRNAIQVDGELTVRLEKKAFSDGTLRICGGMVKPGADYIPSEYDLDIVTEETAGEYMVECRILWDYLCMTPITVPLDVRE